MLVETEKGKFYISKGTPLPFKCPSCDSIIPVASLDGEYPGVDRFSKNQTCWNCNHIGSTEEFDVEWEFKSSN